MIIDSLHFGTLEIDPARSIEFPLGLPGFEQCRRFSLFHEAGSAQPIVHSLQSLDDPALVFSVADPGLFGFHYQLTLSDEESRLLGVESPEDLAVAVILRRAEGAASPVSANLMAPLVINLRTRRALQQVIARTGFDVSFRPQPA